MSEILEGLNPPQVQAVQHIDGPLLVVAGAGSGKTRVITRRIAYLIAQGVAPTSIVAITFTNKAAGEMLSRVRDTLAQFGLAQRGGSPTVATFHAFSAMMLRIHGQAIGIDPNFSIYDTADRAKLIKAACGDVGVLPVGLTPQKIGDRISAAKSQHHARQRRDDAGPAGVSSPVCPACLSTLSTDAHRKRRHGFRRSADPHVGAARKRNLRLCHPQSLSLPVDR
jgi:superfamily I DNA/RNA helicase